MGAAADPGPRRGTRISSGSVLATELARTAPAGVDLCLVGTPDGYGRGVAYCEARPEHRKAQEKAESELLEAKTEAANATADARRKKADLEHMKAHREAILAEYKEAAAETWDEHREICPTCGQALPEEKVEELRADFLQRRSAKLEAINAKGKKEASKETITQLEQDIAALEEKAAAAEARADEIYTARKEAIKAEPPRPDFSGSGPDR